MGFYDWINNFDTCHLFNLVPDSILDNNLAVKLYEKIIITYENYLIFIIGKELFKQKTFLCKISYFLLI